MEKSFSILNNKEELLSQEYNNIDIDKLIEYFNQCKNNDEIIKIHENFFIERNKEYIYGVKIKIKLNDHIKFLYVYTNDISILIGKKHTPFD